MLQGARLQLWLSRIWRFRIKVSNKLKSGFFDSALANLMLRDRDQANILMTREQEFWQENWELSRPQPGTSHSPNSFLLHKATWPYQSPFEFSHEGQQWSLSDSWKWGMLMTFLSCNVCWFWAAVQIQWQTWWYQVLESEWCFKCVPSEVRWPGCCIYH